MAEHGGAGLGRVPTPHEQWWRWPLDGDGDATQPTVNDGSDGDGLDWQDANLALVQDLGRSGQVQMRRCVQSPLGRQVLVLEAAEDPAALQAIGQGLAGLRHPGIQRIHDGGDGILVCADVDGRSLADLLAEADRPAAQVVAALIEVADALAHVHRCGLIHRDIKPASIQLGRYGEVVIVGWGCAVANPQLAAEATDNLPRLTGERLVMGSPSWMAPEQARGLAAAIGPAVDVFGLGACLYALLYGRAPYPGSALESLQAAAAGEPAWGPIADPSLRALGELAQRFMDARPEQRPSAAAAADELRRWLSRSERLAELLAMTRDQPRQLATALERIQAIDAYRDCWDLLPDLLAYRQALVGTVVDAALAGEDDHFAEVFVGMCDPALVLPAVQTALATARQRHRARLRLRRWAQRGALAALLAVAVSFATAAWLSASHARRLDAQRQAQATELLARSSQDIAAGPGLVSAWQQALAHTWQAYGLVGDQPALRTALDQHTRAAMEWALAHGHPTVARAWGLAHGETRGPQVLAPLMERATAAAEDREERRRELDARLADLHKHPFNPWQDQWWANLRMSLNELTDAELAPRLADLIASDAVPLLRLIADLWGERPALAGAEQVHALLAHPHPAVQDMAWQAALRRQDPQALAHLWADIHDLADLGVAAARAQTVGPWALDHLATWPEARGRALLGLLLRGDLASYVAAGRQEASPSTWPEYAQVAWALGDIPALRAWLQRASNPRSAAPWRRLLAVLDGESAQQPWESLFALRAGLIDALPADFPAAMAAGDISDWRGCLPFAAQHLAATGHQRAAGLALARGRVASSHLDHLLEEAERQHRADRVHVLRALRQIYAIDSALPGQAEVQP